MRNIILCGNTGSVNRGCEAIVHSTAKILKLAGYEKNTTVLTFNKNYDEFLNVNDVVDLLAYSKKIYLKEL